MNGEMKIHFAEKNGMCGKAVFFLIIYEALFVEKNNE